MKWIGITAVLVIVATVVVFFIYTFGNEKTVTVEPLDPTPKNVTLSGNFICLPYIDISKQSKADCTFGFKTDDGENYLVNFGQSAPAMELFKTKAHIKAEGFTVIKEALNTNQWEKYNMKGIFTITKIIESGTTN